MRKREVKDSKATDTRELTELMPRRSFADGQKFWEVGLFSQDEIETLGNSTKIDAAAIGKKVTVTNYLLPSGKAVVVIMPKTPNGPWKGNC